MLFSFRYTAVKADGASPKMWWFVRSHDKPIHGSCAIYFPGGIAIDVVCFHSIWYSYIWCLLPLKTPHQESRQLSQTSRFALCFSIAPVGLDAWNYENPGRLSYSSPIKSPMKRKETWSSNQTSKKSDENQPFIFRGCTTWGHKISFPTWGGLSSFHAGEVQKTFHLRA